MDRALCMRYFRGRPMTRYLIRRVLQAIPVLLFISIIVYGLILISPVDPMSIYEENPDITPEDMAMISGFSS